MSSKKQYTPGGNVTRFQAQQMLRPYRNAIIVARDQPENREAALHNLWGFLDATEALFLHSKQRVVTAAMKMVLTQIEFDELGLTNTRVLVGHDRVQRYVDYLLEKRNATRDEMMQRDLGIRLDEARRMLRFLEVLGDVEAEEEVLYVEQL